MTIEHAVIPVNEMNPESNNYQIRGLIFLPQLMNPLASSFHFSNLPLSIHSFKQFIIQMYGIDEHGKTASIFVKGFKPFFYVMVDDKWSIEMKEKFIKHLKDKMGKYYCDSITDSKIIRRKKFLAACDWSLKEVSGKCEVAL